MAHKVESNYDVVAQLLNEMCDAGAVSTTEPNALRDLVEVEGWIGKLLGGINLPGFVDLLPKLLLRLRSSGNLDLQEIRQVPTCLAFLLLVYLQLHRLCRGEDQM